MGRDHVKRLLIAATALMAMAPAAAFAADLSGSWTINGNFNDQIKYSLTCALKQTGTALAGPCKGPQGEAITATGSYDGTNAVISYDTTYQGNPVHLDYKGTVQADGSLAGTIDAGGAQGTFTATKS
jgi:hypothetical protein